MKPEQLEQYAKYARKYQYDIITVGETSATFKEYDRDGFFRVKKTYKEVVKDLSVSKNESK